MIRFFSVLCITALLIIGVVYLAVGQQWTGNLPSFFYQTLIFLTFTTSVIYRYLFKANNPDFFVQLYLLTMSVKLLGYGGYVYFMIVEDRAGAFANVINFMLCYFIFTALEIGFLYKKIVQENTP